MRLRIRWRDDSTGGTLALISSTAEVGNTIVGCVAESANGLWYGYGCEDDWQDVDLGSHSTESKARRAVERWIRNWIKEPSR